MQPDTEINPLSFFSLNISDYEGGVKMQLCVEKVNTIAFQLMLLYEKFTWNLVLLLGPFRP